MSNQNTRTLAIVVDSNNKVVQVLSRAPQQPLKPATIGGMADSFCGLDYDPFEAHMREVREESGL